MNELVFPTGSSSMSQLWGNLNQKEKDLLSDIIDIETIIQVKKKDSNKDSNNRTQEEITTAAALHAALRETRAENAKLLQTLTEKEEAHKGQIGQIMGRWEEEKNTSNHERYVQAKHHDVCEHQVAIFFDTVQKQKQDVKKLQVELVYEQGEKASLLKAQASLRKEQASLKSQMEEIKTTNKNLTNQLAVTNLALEAKEARDVKRKLSLIECDTALQLEKKQKTECLEDEKNRKDLELTLEDALRQQSEKLCQDCRGGSEVKYGRRRNRNT